MSADQLLSTYLNDHLAASLAAVELAKRTAQANSETPIGGQLAQLAEALHEDRDALQRIMNQLGADKDHLKLTAGWTAEKLGRLKLNGRWLSYSPLSRLEEIELLLLGVEGKLLLWQALEQLPEAPRLEPPLDRLVSRARSQRQLLRRLRLRAAELAFDKAR
jgi:hypothetical protein